MEQKNNIGLQLKKTSIVEKLRKRMDDRQERKLFKYLFSCTYNNGSDRKKGFDAWEKISDARKIDIIMYLTTQYHNIDYRFKFNGEEYTPEYVEAMIEDLWINSNAKVQQATAYNRQLSRIPAYNTYIVNINSWVVEGNWRSAPPELQKQFIEELISSGELDSDLFAKADLNLTSPFSKDYNIYQYKSRWILDKIEDTDQGVLLEMFDSIMQLLDNEFLTDEIAQELAGKIPEDIKSEKIDTTFDYLVRDDKLFAEKWGKISYSEKIESLRSIFSQSIFEHMVCFEEMKDTNMIRRMYPQYFRVSDPEGPIDETFIISYDPQVISRIIGDMSGADLDKYLCDIIGQKQANPATIYYIWSSLDRKKQAKYYDQVMGILEEHPMSQYELWGATQTNSENQRKKMEKALSEIKTIEDIKDKKSLMSFLIRGISRGEESVLEQRPNPKSVDYMTLE